MGDFNFQSLPSSKPAQSPESTDLAGILEGSPRYAALLLVCGFILLFFGGLGTIPLLDPDEGRYAEIPREMLLRGDFVTPRLNGVLYFEKPPLYYWLNAAAAAALSSPEIASRLAGAGCGLAGLGLAWLLGSSMGGSRVGSRAAIVLGTTPLYLALARTAIIDMTVTFFLSATLSCFWLAQERDGDRRARPLWYGAFVSAALATLAKGLIGIVIPGAVAFLFLLFTRRWRVLRQVPWVGGPLLFLAIAVPWHVLAAQRNPDFLWFYFIHEHFLRYATPIAERQEPFWFFGPIVVLGMLPWSGLLPAVVTLFRQSSERLRDRPHLVFLACWAGFVILFFSASRSKLVPYILPAFPPLAVLVALALTEVEPTRARTWIRTGAAIGVLLMGCLWAVGPRVALDRSAHEVARFLKGRLSPEDEVYSYRFYPQCLPVYLGRLIGVVRYRGELAFGIDHLPPEVRAHRFPTAEQFHDRWRSSPRPIYLVLESSDLDHMEGDGLAPGPILFRQNRFLLMTNPRFPAKGNPYETDLDLHLSRRRPPDGGQPVRRRHREIGHSGRPGQAGQDQPGDGPRHGSRQGAERHGEVRGAREGARQADLLLRYPGARQVRHRGGQRGRHRRQGPRGRERERQDRASREGEGAQGASPPGTEPRWTMKADGAPSSSLHRIFRTIPIAR